MVSVGSTLRGFHGYPSVPREGDLRLPQERIRTTPNYRSHRCTLYLKGDRISHPSTALLQCGFYHSSRDLVEALDYFHSDRDLCYRENCVCTNPIGEEIFFQHFAQ